MKKVFVILFVFMFLTGCITNSNYIGDYKGSKYHGQGTLVWPSGDEYVGEWKNHKRNGKGI